MSTLDYQISGICRGLVPNPFGYGDGQPHISQTYEKFKPNPPLSPLPT